MAEIDFVMLKNVRLSFPNLFQKDIFEGVEQKYCATLLIPKSNKQMMSTVRAAMKKVQKAKLSDDRICLKDGDEIDYDGYADHYYLKAASNKRPVVINRDKSQVTEADGVIFAGCYVNAQISFWWLAHKIGGKRLLANLYAVQYLKDGASFESTADIDAFEELEEADEGLEDDETPL